jgi:hypothetical protein
MNNGIKVLSDISAELMIRKLEWLDPYYKLEPSPSDSVPAGQAPIQQYTVHPTTSSDPNITNGHNSNNNCTVHSQCNQRHVHFRISLLLRLILLALCTAPIPRAG